MSAPDDETDPEQPAPLEPPPKEPPPEEPPPEEPPPEEPDPERPAPEEPPPEEPPPEEPPPEEPDPERPARLRDAMGKSLLGILKLGAMFIPEIVLALLGGVVGLIVGVVVGVGLTSELFSGPGTWARAGPIALVFPVLAAVGPVVIATLVGLVVPPVVALVPHSLVMLVAARAGWRDRYAVLFLTTLFAWLPGLFALGDGVGAAMMVAVVVSPFTAPLGFAAGAAFVAVRGILDGRSPVEWWREADGSMVLTMTLMTVYAWTVTVLATVLFCLLPTVPFAVALAMACAVQLLRASRHRGLSFVCLGLGAAWSLIAALLLVLVLGSMAREQRGQGSPQEPDATVGFILPPDSSTSQRVCVGVSHSTSVT